MNNKKNCRVSGNPLSIITDFGNQPLGNGFLNENEFNSEYFFHMQVGFCNKSKLFQLIDQPEPQKMFHENYAFYSSLSSHMQSHFREFYNFISSQENYDRDSLVVELGCNDGILLENFSKKNLPHVGVEPSKNVAEVAEEKNVNVIQDFFNEDTVNQILKTYGHAEFFVAANVICHIPNIIELIQNIKLLLSKTGKVIFEDPYLGDVINKTSYDQIYDEHVFLFSAHSVQYMFDLFEMELIDLVPQSTHGGSMRYVIANKGVYEKSPVVTRILDEEKLTGIDTIEKLSEFDKNVRNSRKNLVSLLEKIKSEGNEVVGYAATSKSTTILNYCNIKSDLISRIYDTTPQKIGKFSPGMHIPIIDYKYFKDSDCKNTFLFAWNHFNEIIEKEENYTKTQGKWITHVPKIGFIE